MAATTQFLTSVAQRDLAIVSVTSEATDHPIELAFDQNLNTYWAPTSTAAQNIDLDLQSARSINGVAMFLRNYLTDHSGSELALVSVYYSDNGTDWTGVTGMTYFIHTKQTVGKPLVIGPSDTTISHRYWRIRFSSMSTVVQVSQFFLYRDRSIAVPDSYPHNDRRIYGQGVVKGFAGRAVRTPINRVPVYERRRTWRTTDADDIAAIQGAVQDCAGRMNLAIYAPSDADPGVIEMQDKQATTRQVLYGLYDQTISMRSIPYIADGDIF